MDYIPFKSSLPIQKHKDLFFDALSTSQCIIIEGLAGAGKSTQVPQWAVEYAVGKGRVACAQTRRAAAVSLAARVAEEMGVQLGEEVGYAIRDEEKEGSLLKYCTTGWLLREMKEHPLLEDYAVIVVDEVDERTVYMDILLGLLKQTLKRRQDLKVVLLGSSFNSTKLEGYFGDCAIIKVPVPSTPTEIVYSPVPESKNTIDAAVEAVLGLRIKEMHGGDILLFLATQEEVEKACEEISKRVKGVDCIPLHSSLNLEQLQRLYKDDDVIGRRCIVSTSIGETAVVFDGVSFVIDSGRCQRSFYDPLAPSQPVESISKTMARRRAERAGKRTIRLYSKVAYEEMEEEKKPEVLRALPEKVEELLKICGMEDAANFDFIDNPKH